MDSISKKTAINESQLKEVNNEVLRKIGRNILLFQQMELTLKALVSSANISGYASELKSKQADKIESVKTQTMGQLVGQYIESNNPEQNNNSNEPENLKEAYISISTYIEIDEETHNQQKELMASLVEERNNLVHHFLPTFDSTSFKSCIDAQQKLDKQAEKVRLKVNSLRSILTTQNEMKKDITDFMQTNEYAEFMKVTLAQQSPLANILIDLAQTKSGNDGWVVLNKAVSIINKEFPAEIKNLKQNHGSKKLKNMMIKTKLFEFSDEQTPKGGSRVLYRLKPTLL
jgi:hypothetical protein